MLSRVIFFGLAALLALKLFAPHRLRALGKQLDRGVNLTLILLAVVYSVQLAIYFFSSR
ncbi:MAG TPA: hypothetical protein VER11_26755 [Polyangiaceae bacterium]|nr:hypothetical protein [Polyangiaceae bacterium]